MQTQKGTNLHSPTTINSTPTAITPIMKPLLSKNEDNNNNFKQNEKCCHIQKFCQS